MSDRNIKVTFFTDIGKGYVVNGSTRWYKYARNASMKSFDAMVQNIWGAAVCQIHDDTTSKLLYEFVRHKDNRVETTFNSEAVDNEIYTAQTPAQFKNFTSKKSKTAKVRQTKSKSKK
jgi:hypothetical protein